MQKIFSIMDMFLIKNVLGLHGILSIYDRALWV